MCSANPNESMRKKKNLFARKCESNFDRDAAKKIKLHIYVRILYAKREKSLSHQDAKENLGLARAELSPYMEMHGLYLDQ